MGPERHAQGCKSPGSTLVAQRAEEIKRVHPVRIRSVARKLCSKGIFFSSNKRSWGDNPGLL